MKGIRKLFLGLVFLALVGVGFTVNAKAAVGTISLTTDDSAGKSWSKNASKLVGTFTTGADLFPENTGIYQAKVYTFQLYRDDHLLLDEGDLPHFTAITEADGTNVLLDKNDDPIASKSFSGNIFNNEDCIKKDGTNGIKASFNNLTEEPVYKLILLADGLALDPAVQDTITIRGYRITPKVMLEKETDLSAKLTVSPVYQFVLEGEETADYFKVVGTPSAGYQFDGWYFGVESSGYGDKIGADPTNCKVTPNGTTTKKMIANYVGKSGMYLEFTNRPLADAVLTPNKPIILRKYKFSGGYTGNNIQDITIGGQSVLEPRSFGTKAVDEMIFTTPNLTPSTSARELKIIMDDGYEYKYNVYVCNPSDITFTMSPDTTQTIEVGGKAQYVPKLIPEIYDAKFDYPATTEKDCISLKWDTLGNLDVTGVKATTTGAVFTPTVKFTVEGSAEETKTHTPLTVKVTSPALVFTSDIMVNEGLSAPLSRFVKNENTYVTKAEAKSSSYITVSPATGVARSIEIKGKSATKKVSGEFTADGQTVAVTVYPKPTLSLDKSGSGSSLKYTFKVTMPWNVYHGSTVIKDLSKAKIQFKGEKDTYTLDSFSLEKDTEDYTKKNKDTVSVEIKKMSEILNKICKNDKEEIEITAYADGDKDVISDKQTLKVYKIKVDGSSGADYKVNGETVSDYFYAIDGVSYEVSTTPKSGYSGTPEKWDGTSFGTNSNGTVSFSESKTIKAYYKGGTSSPSTSGRNSGAAGDGTGEGYDDVPKTGESKTDIWILWSVLFISILGAGFMIWKRFGLARAIAEADQQVAIAEHEEMVKAEEKEKKDKLDMLKGLRNL